MFLSKSRDIQDKMLSPKVIWNAFWRVTVKVLNSYSMRKKEPPQAMLETVIISYYRGTTQIDVSSTFSCTNIHS